MPPDSIMRWIDAAVGVSTGAMPSFLDPVPVPGSRPPGAR
jgi:hypothetical protein